MIEYEICNQRLNDTSAKAIVPLQAETFRNGTIPENI